MSDETHLQILSTLEEAGERILADVHLAFVHELQKCLHVVSRRGLQNDIARACMTWGRSVEQFLEVLTACGQDHLVSFELASCNKRISRLIFCDIRHVFTSYMTNIFSLIQEILILETTIYKLFSFIGNNSTNSTVILT